MILPALAAPALACTPTTGFPTWQIAVTEPNVIHWSPPNEGQVVFRNCTRASYTPDVVFDTSGMVQFDGTGGYYFPDQPDVIWYAQYEDGRDITFSRTVTVIPDDVRYVRVRFRIGVMLRSHVPSSSRGERKVSVYPKFDPNAPTGSEDVRLSFSNRMPAPTCTVANGAPRIVLDTVTADQVPSGRKSFSRNETLQFRNCGTARSVRMTFTGTPDPIDGELYRNTASNPAAGIGIALQRQGASDWLHNGTTHTLVISGGQADFTFDASYYSSRNLGEVKAGNVQANIVINLDYN